MTGLVLSLLLSVDPSPVGRLAIEVHAGEVAPFAGLLMPSDLSILTGKRIVDCEARVSVLESSSGPGWPLTIGLSAGVAVVVGVVVGLVVHGLDAPTR